MVIALELTLVAIGALILLSLFFMLLTFVMERVSRIGRGEEVSELEADEERKRVAIATAAVMSYVGKPIKVRVVRRKQSGRSAWKTAVERQVYEVRGWRGIKGSSRSRLKG